MNLPIGEPVTSKLPCPRPDDKILQGQYCELHPLQTKHASQLFSAFQQTSDMSWIYLPYGPFENSADFEKWIREIIDSDDPYFYAILDLKSQKFQGMMSYLRIQETIGSLEIGHIHFSDAMKKTPQATESLYLMLAQAFDTWGYRRCEWKCDNLNQSSKKAAKRFGFTFEGIFRQATVYKGRNRDTAWFSIIDQEWEQVKSGLEQWLISENFDDSGQQKKPLQIIQ